MRYKSKKKYPILGAFVALPHTLLNHSDFISLKPRAVKLLIDLAMQFNGGNNGDLSMEFPKMKKRGWKSNDQLYKARKELIEKDWIIRTRLGGKHKVSLYAISWINIDDCNGKLDAGVTTIPRRKFDDKK